ncbi:hypothetical protein Mapa_012296 [Marchantia paleacea]|nr:hypothetical protein Mapa_012296 [Marchantia paleacea]
MQRYGSYFAAALLTSCQPARRVIKKLHIVRDDAVHAILQIHEVVTTFTDHRSNSDWGFI